MQIRITNTRTGKVLRTVDLDDQLCAHIQSKNKYYKSTQQVRSAFKIGCDVYAGHYCFEVVGNKLSASSTMPLIKFTAR